MSISTTSLDCFFNPAVHKYTVIWVDKRIEIKHHICVFFYSDFKPVKNGFLTNFVNQVEKLTFKYRLNKKDLWHRNSLVVFISSLLNNYLRNNWTKNAVHSGMIGLIFEASVWIVSNGFVFLISRCDNITLGISRAFLGIFW